MVITNSIGIAMRIRLIVYLSIYELHGHSGWQDAIRNNLYTIVNQ